MASTAIPRSSFSAQAALRLLCLPYAGGGAAAFHRWRRVLPGWLDLVPLTLPGHDGRLNESPRTDLRRLAGELADELPVVFDRPYVLLGYSMGAWLAYELALELSRRAAARKIRLPDLLVVAASRPPHVRLTAPPMHLLPEDELVAAVERGYGGIPAAVRASRDLLKLLLPALRADLQMLETYQFADESPLEIPILATGGTEDRAVTPAELGEWARHTSGDFSMRLFPGGHFFLFDGGAAPSDAGTNRRAREVPPALRAILATLKRLVPPARAEGQSLD